MSLKLNSSGGGSVTLQEPSTASNVTLTLPATAGTIQVSGAAISGTTGSFSGDLSFNSGYGSAAVAYGCRAWVNFNGTGTVAIRASGNVSSITDNGTGTYDVNYATALPANMCPVALCTDDSISNRAINIQSTDSTNNLTSRCRVTIWQASGGSVDSTGVYVAVFR